MLAKVFRRFDGPELLMLAAGSVLIVVGFTYLF